MSREEPTRLTTYELTAHVRDHRPDPEDSALWLVDHLRATSVRCRCLGSSGMGMQLLVPRGHVVAIGQRYEVCAYPPGERPAAGCDLIGSAWVTAASAEPPDRQDQRHVVVLMRRVPIEDSHA